jgi:transcriptional adapter 2-alpha
MPGSDLAGYMPRRGDFDIEWDNDAEKLLQDMEFTPGDTPEERARKIKVLAIYNARLDVREERKQFIKDRGLLDYRKKFQEDNKLPSDERDLKNRMRLFARFQTPQEHDKLVQNLLQAKRLRKEIARLQMYRRMGFTSLADAEKFELDRNRREFHRVACENREKEERKATAVANELGMNGVLSSSELNGSYLKQSKSKRNSFEPVLGETATTVNSEALGQIGTSLGTVDAASKPAENGVSNFDVKKCPGHELLTKKELDLCQKLQCQPQLYTKAKTALIQEALKQDMLDDENSRVKTLFKIDIEKKDDVIKFIASSGWIPKLPAGKAKKTVS